jgi:hypothetical protein
MRRSLVFVICVLLGAGCTACGEPRGPKTSELPGASASSSADPDAPAAGGGGGATRPPTRLPQPPRSTAPPSPSGFSEYAAVACNGRPSAAQVIALLRRTSVLRAGARPTVTSGPLCAGTWQYTVLTLPDEGSLYVVTHGRPEALVVETAGTNPCTARVRANAPAGIVSAIRC